MSDLHVHSAGDSETAEPVKLSVLQTEPVLLLMAASMFTQAIGAVVLITKRQWMAAIIAMAVVVLTGFAATLTRSLVTPMSRPRDADGDPLTPLVSDAEDAEADSNEPHERTALGPP
jgi:hypothetical protein